MFRASSAHLQEDTIVYKQHMVLSLSTRVRVGLSVLSTSCWKGYRVTVSLICCLKTCTFLGQHGWYPCYDSNGNENAIFRPPPPCTRQKSSSTIIFFIGLRGCFWQWRLLVRNCFPSPSNPVVVSVENFLFLPCLIISKLHNTRGSEKVPGSVVEHCNGRIYDGA